MPCVTAKQKYLSKEREKLNHSLRFRRLRFFADMEDDDYDDMDMLQKMKYRREERCRYLFRNKYRPRISGPRCEEILHGNIFSERESSRLCFVSPKRSFYS